MDVAPNLLADISIFKTITKKENVVILIYALSVLGIELCCLAYLGIIADPRDRKQVSNMWSHTTCPILLPNFNSVYFVFSDTNVQWFCIFFSIQSNLLSFHPSVFQSPVFLIRGAKANRTQIYVVVFTTGWRIKAGTKQDFTFRLVGSSGIKSQMYRIQSDSCIKFSAGSEIWFAVGSNDLEGDTRRIQIELFLHGNARDYWQVISCLLYILL